jgi:hypothetical protein
MGASYRKEVWVSMGGCCIYEGVGVIGKVLEGGWGVVWGKVAMICVR